VRGQQLQEDQESVVLAVLAVNEATAMSTRLDALGDQDIRAGGNGGLRLVRVGHGYPDLGSGLVESPDFGGFRTTECEGHHRYPLGHGQLDFGRERVVVVAGHAQFNALPVCFPSDLREVGGEGARVDIVVGDEDIQPVRRLGEAP